MQITRREFLKWAATSAAVLGLSQLDIFKLEKAIADSNSMPVIWIQGASCTGCAVSLLNVTDPTTIDQVLLNSISMKYHPNLSAAAGHMAMEKIEYEMVNKLGQFILIVEGSVTTGAYGKYCVIGEKTDGTPWTLHQAVLDLGSRAKYIIGAGTCSAFGGIPGANPNPTGVVRLDSVVDPAKVINLPACPVNPTHLVKVIVNLITNTPMSLDSERRPVEFYGPKIHGICPRRGSAKATQVGQPGCLVSIGCKGQGTYINCPNVMWNNKTNWCIGGSHPCIGCAAPNFPDGQVPFYKF